MAFCFCCDTNQALFLKSVYFKACNQLSFIQALGQEYCQPNEILTRPIAPGFAPRWSQKSKSCLSILIWWHRLDIMSSTRLKFNNVRSFAKHRSDFYKTKCFRKSFSVQSFPRCNRHDQNKCLKMVISVWRNTCVQLYFSVSSAGLSLPEDRCAKSSQFIK